MAFFLFGINLFLTYVYVFVIITHKYRAFYSHDLVFEASKEASPCSLDKFNLFLLATTIFFQSVSAL